jgi:hypothetical protein
MCISGSHRFIPQGIGEGMLTLLFAAALALQDAPIIVDVTPQAEPPRPEGFVALADLPIEQAAAARCAIALATVSRWQKAGDPRGEPYPNMETGGGREFFVQVMAKLMDTAGLTRENVIALAFDGVEDHDKPDGAERVAQMMPACELMKSAAGL